MGVNNLITSTLQNASESTIAKALLNGNEVAKTAKGGVKKNSKKK